MKGKISVIIPTLNEESHITICLNSVFQQDNSLIEEIIVADGYSTDNTVNIAKKFNVKIVLGGIPGIARNNGAKAANGNYLLFLDADTILPPQFLKHAIFLFEKKNLIIASFYLTPTTNSIFAKIILKGYNTIASFFASWLPVFLTAGCCVLVTQTAHNTVGGFSNSVVVLEEYDYIQRIKKLGKFAVIPLNVITSTRRFQRGRCLQQTIVLFIYYFQWFFTRKISTDRFGYWIR